MDTPETGLDEGALDRDPVAQFSAWLADAAAAGLPEHNAMALATVSASGQPRARTVLLKGHDADGFVFYTNRTSRKGRDLAEVPRASLLFGWYAIQRQVIIEGTVTELTAGQSEPYFHSRPRGSQLGAWTSRQSAVIASRAGADAAVLGRLPRDTAHLRVLAGPGEPAARPVPLPPRRRPVADRAAGALIPGGDTGGTAGRRGVRKNRLRGIASVQRGGCLDRAWAY